MIIRNLSNLVTTIRPRPKHNSTQQTDNKIFRAEQPHTESGSPAPIHGGGLGSFLTAVQRLPNVCLWRNPHLAVD